MQFDFLAAFARDVTKSFLKEQVVGDDEMLAGFIVVEQRVKQIQVDDAAANFLARKIISRAVAVI